MADLNTDVRYIKGIGETRAKSLNKLNIFTLRDLLHYFPRGYEDRTQLINICELQPDIPACFRATVMNTPRVNRIRKGLDITRVQVADPTARLNLVFFNQKFAADQLHYGEEYNFYGTLSGDYGG